MTHIPELPEWVEFSLRILQVMLLERKILHLVAKWDSPTGQCSHVEDT